MRSLLRLCELLREVLGGARRLAGLMGRRGREWMRLDSMDWIQDRFLFSEGERTDEKRIAMRSTNSQSKDNTDTPHDTTTSSSPPGI